MWETEFIIAKQTIDRKVIIIVSLFLLNIAFFKLNTLFHFIPNKDNLSYLLIWIIIMLALPFYLIFFSKNYRNIGSLFLSPTEFRLEYANRSEQFSLNEMKYLELFYRGTNEDTQIRNMRRFDFLGGSGNILEFDYRNENYKIDIVFEKMKDYNNLVDLFNEIEKRTGFKPKIINRL